MLLAASVIAFGVAAFCFGIIAIASNWNGIARVISFLVAFSTLPLAVKAQFPESARHMKAALSVAACFVVALVAIWLSRFGWHAIGPSLENTSYEEDIRDADNGPLYAADFASGRSPGPRNAPRITEFERPWLYGATAYDAAMICLQSIRSVLEEHRAPFGSFSFRARVALAAKPLRLGIERSFRRQVVSKINWLNTGAPGSVRYHGVTGTYSFTNHDADGAAGVSIWTYDRTGPAPAWKPVKTGAPLPGG